MMSIFDVWFSGVNSQSKWVKKFESRIDEIGERTRMSKKELRKVAEVLLELQIIEEKDY